MKERLLFLAKLYAVLLAVFALQRVVFMAVNAGFADGAPFASCVASLWHGLRLDVVSASYVAVLPLLVLALSCFWRRFRLRRVLVPYWWLIALVAGTVLVADIVLYWFWGAKLDANDLMYAVKPKDMLASLHWWAVLGGLAVVGATVWLVWLALRRATPRELGPVANRWWALLFVPLAGLVFLGMRGGVSESTANVSYAYFSRYAFCNHAALNPLFNMVHSLAKSEDLAGEFAFFDEDAATGVAEGLLQSDATVGDTLLRVQRPDVLMIVWEGGGWDMVANDSVGPCLMRLADEGVLFSGCYANNFRTDRGLVSLLSGWQGLPTTSLMKLGDRCRRLPGLARTLAAEGYRTRFVYGGDVDFTNMRGYLMETGFERVEGSEAFPASRRKSGWGAPDAYTLLPSVLGYSEGDGRRFDVVLTLSSHEPWEVPMQKLVDERRNSFAYTDSCLGVLMDSLRAMPQWDSLLVIIVPDHGVPLSGGQSTSDWRVSHVPMVWTGGAVRGHRVVDNMMMQSDLAATLLSQMGIAADGFLMSRNVLAPGFGQRQHWALHCFKNGCNWIDSTGVLRFDCGDSKATVVNGSPDAENEDLLKAMLQYVYHRTAKL